MLDPNALFRTDSFTKCEMKRNHQRSHRSTLKNAVGSEFRPFIIHKHVFILLDYICFEMEILMETINSAEDFG